MKFCDKCGNVLIAKNEDRGRFLFCKKCGKKSVMDENIVFITKNECEKKEIAVFENEEPNFPTTETLCPKCQGLHKVEWCVIQTRAADEPPTRFYRCLKCRHVWREYS